jgi:hypothetical protein
MAEGVYFSVSRLFTYLRTCCIRTCWWNFD